jgi:hypothetical protein
MAPDPQNFPSFTAKQARDAAITHAIFCDFFIPISAVRLGTPVAAWAAMPETAINKNGDLELGKGKIGCSRKFQVPVPTRDLVPTQ